MPTLDKSDGLIRLTEANYADGIGALAGGIDPVEISRLLFDQDGAMPNNAGLSTFFTTWGQFIDHDLSLTPESHDELMTTDGLVAPVGRSDYASGSGDNTPRLPVNAITWQIDGSQIYGSTDTRLTEVRAFEGGKLRMSWDETSDHGLLPQADDSTFMAGDISSDNPVYLAGDIRANENPNLLSLHTMMAREHNYWAGQLAEAHPDWDDDQLFAGARQIVEYEIQKITYDQWLPHLIGDALPDDIAYDPAANGQISVEFSTAAFRFGHTLVSSSLDALADDGSDSGSLGLMDGFFQHEMVQEGGIDALIRGMLDGTAQELDTKVVDDLNFFLSTPAGVSGFSLVAINLLRGQDHGLQSYIDTRAALLGDIDRAALDPTDFSILTTDPQLQADLAAVFPTVHDIPLWVGGLAEDAIDGTQLGPLFTHIVADQFYRTRAADIDFGTLSPELGEDILAAVQNSDLAALIARTTDIDMVQDDPFLASARALSDAAMPHGTDAPDQMDMVAKDMQGDLFVRQGNDALSLRGGTQISGSIKTGPGHDQVTMTSGHVAGDIATGSGKDSVDLYGTAKIGDDILTGDGADRVRLSDMAQVRGDIRTGGGADEVTLDNRATVHGGIKTGDGADRITLSAKAAVDGAVMAGGSNDRIILESGAHIAKINGGSGRDTLQLSPGARVEYDDDSSGRIYHEDAAGNEIVTAFQSIERIICFTPGTRIITATGVRRIDDLQVGDRVWTLDHGLQPLRWIGRTTVPARGDLAPIRIRKGALGNDHDLRVSPQHRMLLDGWRVELHCATPEVLAPARGLVNDSTIRPDPGECVTYIHLAFDCHQIVMAEGIPTESFYPGAEALSALDQATRDEVLRLFPEWAGGHPAPIDTARPVLTVGETRAIAAARETLDLNRG